MHQNLTSGTLNCLNLTTRLLVTLNILTYRSYDIWQPFGHRGTRSCNSYCIYCNTDNKSNDITGKQIVLLPQWWWNLNMPPTIYICIKPTWTNRAAHSRLLDWIYAGYRTHLPCTRLLADATLTMSACIFMPIFTLMVCGTANRTGFWGRWICNVKPKISHSKMGYTCYCLADEWG